MKLTVRARLTLVYGGVFVLAGLVLLGATYVLVTRELTTTVAETSEVHGTKGEPVPVDPAKITIQKAAETTRVNVQNAVVTQSGIALVIVSAVAIGLGWLIAGRMLRPLHQITETARRIADAPSDGRGLRERIALTGPKDELQQLADTFDHMLERLDHAFDGQRRFIASASHELRTPLTLNRALLEVALTPEDSSPEVRQLGTTLLAINHRHGQLIDGLLMLAQSERDLPEGAYVDLADIVNHVADPDHITGTGPVTGKDPVNGKDPVTGTGPVKIITETREAPVLGDPVLLEHLVRNLVENGIRHNIPEGGWLRIHTDTTPDGLALLEVSNSGPVVPRYEVPALFEPFRRYRTERLQAPGAGLGLSIVRSVARAHGGDARAEARDEGGLIVTVTLPHAE